MRKRLTIGLLVVLGLVGAIMLVKALGGKKPRAGRRSAQTADSTGVGRTRRSRRALDAADTLGARVGRTARSARGAASRIGAKGKRGTLKGMTAAEKDTERKRIREEKKRLKKELQRKRREERLAQRASLRRGRQRRSGRRSLYDAYTLKGTVAGTYALVGTRRLERGDVVAGKKIVEIGSDRISLEQYGQRFTVRLGEPVDPGVLTSGRRKKQ